MGRIRVLEDGLINRIAAGEVVERPASVVKELVENSLDAGAGSIEVELVAGGRQRIRVSDDGCGMDRDDALLAVERHATSKLQGIGDLSAIRSLGFRGEALASIAAVSRFTLSTAAADGAGTEVEIHGGRIRRVRELGLPRGTTIRVERLFFNTPARRKFLKSEGTELSHCLRWLTRHALSCPALRLRVAHGPRRLLDLAAASDPRQRVVQVHGAEFASRLLPFEADEPGVRVKGLAGRPVEALPRRDGQYLFVNGRAVVDRVLAHAVAQAYGNTVPPGRHPAVFLYVELEAENVDVNVHPQKTEVRFHRPSAVHDLVRDALAAALSQEGAVPRLTDLRPAALEATQAGVREAALSYLDGEATRPVTPAPGGRAPWTAEAPIAPARPGARQPPEGAAPRWPAVAAAEPRIVPREAAPAVLAQFRDSYIIASDAGGLVLVDQHAAHERVLFERYLADAEANRVETQRLLFPVTVELKAQDVALIEEELDEFRRLGFELEPFGAQAVKLDGVPALATELDPAALLRELVGETGRRRSAVADVAAVRARLVTTAACKAAIKIHHPLKMAAMQQLLDDLFAAANPTTCPHGRPIVFRLTLEEIERAFRRR